jgi:hypothetical protein
MNVGRRTDGLLSAQATLRLLNLAAATSHTVEQLQSALRLLESASLARTLNTLSLLSDLGLISIRHGAVEVNQQFSNGAQAIGFLRGRLVAHYIDFVGSVAVGSVFQLRQNDDRLWVDRLQLPGRDLGLPYALLEFGVVLRDGPEDRFWWVAPDATGAFLELINKINHSTTKQLSLRGLKALQEAQEKAGEKGEQFVVRFEKVARSRHPLQRLIRSISAEDTGAGFDVLSFETDTALLHDKFIEVKSYADTPMFYWSAGEIEAAEELQERYWLYLVDRNRIDEAEYVPEMIQNPHAYFIDRQAEGWLREEQGYKFTAVC